MTRLCLLVVLFIAALAPAAETRPFRLGFTTWPSAPTVEAVTGTYTFIAANGDLLAEHIEEGVPWQAAADGKPFPKEFAQKMQGRAKNRPKGMKLLLSITPLDMGRQGFAELVDDKGKRPVPKEWADKKFNDPAVKAAYLAYVRWMIDTFRPDYLLTGIETNELLNNRPAAWDAYRELSAHVRAEIKKQHPDMVVAESVTLHKLLEKGNKKLAEYQKAIREFIAGHDFCPVSFYPFFLGQHKPAEFDEAFKFLTTFTDKRIAIAETGHPAEDLAVKRWNLNFPATAAEQDDYVTTLLKRAQADRYLFVTWYASKDFDDLWATFPESVKDLGRLWRDTGLVDEKGKERPGLATWKKELGRPLGDGR
jgi:hypothetical protein